MSAAEWLMTNGVMLLGGMLLGRSLAHYLFGDNVGTYLHHLRETVPAATINGILIVITLVALAGAAVVLVGLLRLPKVRRNLSFALFFCAVAVFAAAMRRLQHDFEPIGPFTAGSRYCFIPYVFFAWTFLLLMTTGGYFRKAGIGLLILMLLSTMSILGPPPTTENRHWADYIARYKRGESVSVPIPPDGEGEARWRVNLVPKR